MKKNHLIIMTMLTVCGILGCSIQEIPEGGDTCPSDKSGEISYVQFSTSKCERADFATCLEENHKAAIDYGICPSEAPKCATNQDNQYFCTQDCSTHENGWTSACDGQCIDPKTDERYCGASEICEGYIACTKNQECIDGTCTDIEPPAGEPSCTKDEIKCEDIQGMGLKSQCDGTSFNVIDICQNVSCRDNDCGECLNDTVVCQDDGSGKGQLKTCQNGAYQVANCPNDMPCLNEIECAECTFETPKCQDVDGVGQITSCLNGKTTTQACPDNLPCLNETQCAACNSNTPDSCTYDQTIQQSILTQCKDGVLDKIICEKSCNNNGCGVCINGTMRCNNDGSGIGQVDVCENGTWVPSKACTNASCNAEGTNCGDCLNSTQVVCANNADGIGILATCINGMQTKQTCPGNAPCNGNICGENCIEGATTCTDDGGKGGKQYTCTNNTLASTPCPDNAMCNGNVCGTCNIDNNACANDSITKIGTVSQCTNGNLATFSCPDQNSCNAKGTCGSCNNNQKPSCTNDESGLGVLTKCIEGNLTQIISSDKSCNADYTDIGECKNGARSCVHNDTLKTYQSQECINGTWQYETCKSCTSDGKCAECKNGYSYPGYENYMAETKCSNNTLFVCKDGKWPETGTQCTKNLGCASEQKCIECEEGTSTCKETYPGTSYAYASLTSCIDGLINHSMCKSRACNEEGTACAE